MNKRRNIMFILEFYIAADPDNNEIIKALKEHIYQSRQECPVTFQECEINKNLLNKSKLKSLPSY